MFGTKRALAAIMVSGIALSLLTAQGLAASATGTSGTGPDSQGRDAKAPAAKPAPVANLTAAQIVEKHVAARGGVQAWKSVQTLQLAGKIDAGTGDSYERSMRMMRSDKRFAGKPSKAQAAQDEAQEANKQVQLPFTLAVKRPHMSRLEIQFAGKTAVQVYDGTHGWKLRPFLNRSDAEPFTAEEAQSEAAQDNLEGPLFDFAAKGTKVSLEAVEAVQGNKAYKLKLTMKDGSSRLVWIDAKSFLDVKVQGTPRRMDGRMRDVFVYQRDFRAVQGVTIPFVLETAVDGSRETHTLVVEKAAVNPQLDDALFTKPHA